MCPNIRSEMSWHVMVGITRSKVIFCNEEMRVNRIRESCAPAPGVVVVPASLAVCSVTVLHALQLQVYSRWHYIYIYIHYLSIVALHKSVESILARFCVLGLLFTTSFCIDTGPWELSSSNIQTRASTELASWSSYDSSGWMTISVMWCCRAMMVQSIAPIPSCYLLQVCF